MRAVLFDFDFTLADSEAAIVRCVNHALVGMGLPKAAPEQIRRGIGLSLERIYELLTGEDGDGAQRFRTLFIEEADRVMAKGTTLYPWVAGTIETLRSRGLALGIVTTKRRYRVHEVLEREGLADRFAVIVGADMVRRTKPDPEPLERALEELGLEAGEVLYVGDNSVDAMAAAAAGVPFAGVLTGTTPRQELERLGARAVLPSAATVPDLLDRHPFR
ncbi:MAG TPA: HAD family hydrolase [Acidobacteria bacterium]|nr:HAD family hydrolase [Acidobacteriota bacterium]